ALSSVKLKVSKRFQKFTDRTFEGGLMAEKLKHLPEGYHTATPYLIVKDANGALEFYKKAFGAVVLERMEGPDGGVMHAEIKIGDSPVMIGEHQDVNVPKSKSLPLVSIYLYVEDVDTVFRQAIAAGAKELNPVSDKFYGNREGGIEDP